MPKTNDRDFLSMFQPGRDRRKVKEDIKAACAEGDLMALMYAGFESFLDVLFGDGSAPISFRKFLDHTGSFFDRFVLEASRKEHLDYIGGKMILQLDHSKRKVGDAIPIQLSADLYFQTADKQWIVKKKQGQVDSSRFTDWDTDTEAIKLQRTGKLELSIEPPTA